MALNTEDKVFLVNKFNSITDSMNGNNKTLELHQTVLLEAIKDTVTDATLQLHALIKVLYKNGLIDIDAYNEEKNRLFLDNDSEYFFEIRRRYEEKIIKIESGIREDSKKEKVDE